MGIDHFFLSILPVNTNHGRLIRPHVPLLGVWKKLEIKTLVRLDGEDALIGGGLDQAADQLHHILASVDVEIVWRRAENQPGRLGQPGPAAEPDEDVGRHGLDQRLDFQGRHVFAENFGRGVVLFGEGGRDGAAADGLQAQRPGTGEQIDGVLALDGGAYEVEKRFPYAVFHGPHPLVATVAELSTTEVSADNPHSDRSGLGRSRGFRAAFFHVLAVPWRHVPQMFAFDS